MSARPTEVKTLAALLTDDVDYESPEACVKHLINTLDQLRRERLDYIAVMQFGSPGSHITTALGPYVSYKGAEKAVRAHPAASMASVVLVCSLQSPEGAEAALEALDTPVEPKGARPADAGFWAKVTEIKNGERFGMIGTEIKVIKLSDLKTKASA